MRGISSWRWGSFVVLAALGAATPVAGQGVGTSKDGPAFFNHVEVRTTVTSALPDGATVKKGDVVCTLDPAPVKLVIEAQAVAAKAAEVAYLEAKLAREVAEIAVTSYVEGGYRQEVEALKGSVALAETDLRRAEDRLAWSDRMLQQGFVSLGENIGDKLALQRAKFAVEQAQMRLKVLQDFTRIRTVKELQSAVEKARGEELRREAAWRLETGRLKAAEAQSLACEAKAPADGTVRLAPLVEEGAVVRDGQLLFRVFAGGVEAN